MQTHMPERWYPFEKKKKKLLGQDIHGGMQVTGIKKFYLLCKSAARDKNMAFFKA